MLQHLLDLLLSAKSGVLAGVLLIGTTGALVTATVQNGVTTITITQASASPTGTASTTSTATASPTSTATASPSSSPSSSPAAAAAGSSACADQAHAMATNIQTVNSAYSKLHSQLEHMRGDSRTESARLVMETADKDMKDIRQAAVKAIQATKTCSGTNAHEDEDKDTSADQDEDKDTNEDQDEDNDNEESSNHAQGNFLLVFLTNLLGHSTTTTTTTTASPSPTPTSTATATATATATTAPVTTFSGSDPKAIADEAIAAMQVVFDNAVAELASPTASPTTHRAAPTAKPEHTRRPDPSNKHSEGHD